MKEKKKKKTVEGHSSKGERNLNPRSYQQLNVGKQLRFWIWSCNYRSPFTHRTVRRECDLQVSMGCELQATGLGLLHPHQCLANNRLSLDVGVGSWPRESFWWSRWLGGRVGYREASSSVTEHTFWGQEPDMGPPSLA